MNPIITKKPIEKLFVPKNSNSALKREYEIEFDNNEIKEPSN